MQTPPCASLSTLETERPYQMSVFLGCSHKTHIINAKYCAAVNEKREPSQKTNDAGPHIWVLDLGGLIYIVVTLYNSTSPSQQGGQTG